MATTHADPPDLAEPAAEAPKMSKRQHKRMLKMEWLQQNKKAKKEAAKEEKQKAAAKKKEQIDSLLAGMTEEERAQWHTANKQKRQQAATERAALKAKHQQALQSPHQLVIDLDFNQLMTPSELRSLCQQLSYSYSQAVNGEQQLHLHLLGVRGDVQQMMTKQLPGHPHWSATKSDQGFQEFFKDRLQDLVYLSADSPNELQQLDSSKIYIIGGLVDRNRHKGICYKRAQQAGISTARLPIAQHVKLQSSQVITIDQVVKIISLQLVKQDWKAVLEEVLPERKRAATGAGAAAAAAAAAGSDAGAAAAAAAGSDAGDGDAGAEAGAEAGGEGGEEAGEEAGEEEGEEEGEAGAAADGVAAAAGDAEVVKGEEQGGAAS